MKRTVVEIAMRFENRQRFSTHLKKKKKNLTIGNRLDTPMEIPTGYTVWRHTRIHIHRPLPSPLQLLPKRILSPLRLFFFSSSVILSDSVYRFCPLFSYVYAVLKYLVRVLTICFYRYKFLIYSPYKFLFKAFGRSIYSSNDRFI